MKFLKNKIDKLRAFGTARPKLALPIFASTLLLVILLVSLLIALVMEKDSDKVSISNDARVALVEITKDGFVPATISVEKGTKVIWKNSDKKTHQIQANPHPTGESLPGLKSEILNNTQTYEYIADSPGTYGYHDHGNPTTNGSIEVKE